MIRCGIIGVGKMGRIRANAIEESGKGIVTAVYEPEAIDIPYRKVADEKEILDDPDIDAIFVCTPNYRIPALCKEVLRAGKHVFAEKPPAFTAAEIEEVMKVEEQTNLTLMYGFNHRHHGSIKKIKQIVDYGSMGKILWMRGRYGKEVDEDYFTGWRAKPELAGGGIMLDQGIHMLDLFLHLGGNFDEVQAMVSNLYWKINGIEDNVFLNIRSSKTGICASLHSTMTQWRYLFSLEVFLEGGSIILNGLKTSSGAYGDEALYIKRNQSHMHDGSYGSEEKIVYHENNSWMSEINHFLNCIEEEKKVSNGSSNDAYEVMKIIDQIYNKKV
jgi:1,5-anhydro-D-fructose reductase (1,5-anhydro-D-mannitol-forming)